MSRAGFPTVRQLIKTKQFAEQQFTGYMPVILATWKMRQAYHEFKTSLEKGSQPLSHKQNACSICLCESGLFHLT
jgi:hypothetical protein